MEEENEMKMNERKKKKEKKYNKKSTQKNPKKWTMVTTQFNSIFMSIH
jgi:hypothetical protein